MEELKQFRGCSLVLLGFVIMGIFGAAGEVLVKPNLGEQYLGPVVFTGLVLAFLVPISLSKGARWAKIFTGILLLILGVAATVFILVDFATALIRGQGMFTGDSGGAYGQSVFIIAMVGVAMAGLGAWLIGWIKMDLTR
jgi:hypothetical protein